jgi:hypothetical protein
MLGRAPDARQALVLPSCSLNSRNRMARLPKPEDVFTPARPVSDDMFATRQYEHLQDRVEAALDEQGRQVVLFGLTGVGKTSLANYLCRNREIERIRIECGSPFEDMMREALGKVVGREEIEWIEKESAEIGIGATLAGLFNLGGKASLGAETKYARYPVSLATTAAEAFRLKGVRILFLDNFENLAAKEHYAETATEIVQMMKSFSDRAAEYGVDAPKVILAGIPKASEDLIKLDGATARRTAQIEVPRMPPSEIDQILVRGENKLGIEFAGLARDRIIQFSDGFPYYTHLIALHCARQALKDGRREVWLEDFDAALDAILADCDLELRSTYDSAVETSGEVQLRKSVMEAIAALNDLEVPFRDIRRSFLGLHPEYETVKRLNFLSTVIAPLKGEYGILSDSGKPKSPHNRYRFTNPLMRAYVRLRMHRERQRQFQF